MKTVVNVQTKKTALPQKRTPKEKNAPAQVNKLSCGCMYFSPNISRVRENPSDEPYLLTYLLSYLVSQNNIRFL